MISVISLRFILGHIVLGLALLMIAPCMLAWYLHTADLKAFLTSEVITLGTGLLLVLAKRPGAPQLRAREIFLLTTTSWLTICVLGALPFIFSHTVSNFTDAVFESVSGVTTTGATVLTGIDQLPRDILLWRSMMQWIGGLGIVALGAAVLPYLRIGGMRLFKAESSDFSEKALPHTRRILLQLLLVYAAISTACAISYLLAGMSLFDAINHAMTTVSTGGYSTHSKSFAYFQSAGVETVAIVFMLIAAVPFMLYIRMYSGNIRELFHDTQVHSMLVAYFFIAVILVLWLAVTGDVDVIDSFREAVFSVVSIGTTTGFVSEDYATWGTFAVIVFFFLTFVGGCSGSTSGGIKIFRFKIATVMFAETIKRLLHPNVVVARTIQGRPLTDEIMASVMAFSLAFAFTVCTAAILMAAAGNDFVTSFSAAATATANVGPGIGSNIGPTSDFSALSQPSKWILCVAMLLGRLEIFTVVALLTPAFWRN